MKSTLSLRLLAPLSMGLVIIGTMTSAQSQIVNINNSNFNTGTGNLAGAIQVLGATPTTPQQIGNTGWYGDAGVATLAGIVSFRPGVEVNNGASSPSRGELNYGLSVGVGGLAGLEMPEADLYQPLFTSLAANTTYQFSVNFISASALTATLLGDNGFGLGITTGASATSLGTFYADSLSNPALLNIGLLQGSATQLTLTFTTGATPVTNAGVVVFAGRGNQGISASLLSSYSVDDASLQVVPEPQTTVLMGLGLVMLLGSRRIARTFFSGTRNSNS